MKKIFLLLIASVSLFSCSDEEVLNDGSKLNNGGFARFQDNVVQTIDYAGGAGKLEYTVVDPNANAVQYRIYGVAAVIGGVNVPAKVANVPITYVPANLVFTGFPAKVSISLQQFADILAPEGVTLADITYGTSFTILAEVTTADGKVYRGQAPATTNAGATVNNTSADLLNTTFGYKQAMQFSVTVACPSYDAASMLGTYSAAVDTFGAVPTGHTFQCVQGSSPSQLVFVNWTNEGYNLVVDINPASQGVVVNKQLAWNASVINPTYGIASVEGNGLVFSCVNTVNLNLKHTVALGSFGTFPLSLVKQ